MRFSDLRQVPCQYLLDAMDRLPPCSPESTVECLDIDIPLGGTFRVTFRAHKQARRGWPTSWIWIPVEAVQLESGEAPEG